MSSRVVPSYIRPDIRCTEIVDFYYIGPFKRNHPSYNEIIHCRRDNLIRGGTSKYSVLKLYHDVQTINHVGKMMGLERANGWKILPSNGPQASTPDVL